MQLARTNQLTITQEVEQMNSSVRINKSFDITVSINKSIPSERKLALEVKPKMYLSYPSADEKKNIQVEIIDFKNPSFPNQ